MANSPWGSVGNTKQNNGKDSDNMVTFRPVPTTNWREKNGATANDAPNRAIAMITNMHVLDISFSGVSIIHPLPG
jgi:hypothetical protein